MVLLLVVGFVLFISTRCLAADLPELLWLGNQTVSLKDSSVYYRVMPKIQYYLGYPKGTAKCLVNTKRLFPIAHNKLREHNLPDFLSYIIAAESCGRIDAVSRKRARGPWQIMPSTGARLGYSYWDLSHPGRSSEFAAKYLKKLYEQFGDWLLVIAAYNTGEGNVQEAIDRQKTRNFWRLQLHTETMNFVPTVLAYMIIDKQGWLSDWQNPNLAATFSLQLSANAPVHPDWPELATLTLKIKNPYVRATDLAQWGGVPISELLMFNLHLNQPGFNLRFIPQGELTVRIPKFLQERFVTNLSKYLSQSVEVIK